MVDYHLLIIDDLKTLIHDKKLSETIDSENLKIATNTFKDLLFLKYNSISDFINKVNYCNADYKRFKIEYKGIKIIIDIKLDGSYKLKVEYKLNISKSFSSIYLQNEFLRTNGFVYFIKSQYGWKVGKAKNINDRLKTFEVKLPFDFDLKYYIKTINYHSLEKELHDFLKVKNINGEWFELNEIDFIDIKKFLRVRNYKLSQAIDNKNNNILKSNN